MSWPDSPGPAPSLGMERVMTRAGRPSGELRVVMVGDDQMTAKRVLDDLDRVHHMAGVVLGVVALAGGSLEGSYRRSTASTNRSTSVRSVYGASPARTAPVSPSPMWRDASSA